MSRKVIPPLVQGFLRQFGYSAYSSEQERRKALDEAVKNYGGLSVFRKLNAIYVLNKNKNPSLAKVFLKDREYVYRKYYNTDLWESKVTISKKAREKLARKGLLKAPIIKKIVEKIRGRRKRKKKADPDIEVRKEPKPAEVLGIGEVLKIRDWKAKGLVRVVKGTQKEFPEFALYLSKKKAKPDVHDWHSLLLNAGFTKEKEDKYVLRTNKLNLFVYFV